MVTAIEVVQRMYAAVEARDLDGLLDCYDESVEIAESTSLPYGGTYRGLAGAARHAEAFARAWPEFILTGSDDTGPRFVDAGAGTVVVLFRPRAVDAHSGQVLDTPEVAVYEVAGEKVVRSRMFHLDPAALASFLEDAAAGVEPSPRQGSELRHSPVAEPTR
jgi:ketosteroid isomerase-like protein